MKEPIETLILDKFTIQVYDESDYSFNLDIKNEKHYGNVYLDIDRKQPTSLFGLEVLVNELRFRSCLIGSSGGITLLSPDTACLIHSTYVICCADMVFAFSMPSLELLWKTKADDNSCLEIVEFGRGYVVCGETHITCLSNKGAVLWKQACKDLFASSERTERLRIVDQYILITDDSHNKCILDAEGKRVTAEAFNNRSANSPIAGTTAKSKTWWKVWD